jgi:hypothetical protein
MGGRRLADAWSARDEDSAEDAHGILAWFFEAGAGGRVPNGRIETKGLLSKREREQKGRKEESNSARDGPVLEPIGELLDDRLVTTDIGQTCGRVLGRPKLRRGRRYSSSEEQDRAKRK